DLTGGQLADRTFGARRPPGGQGGAAALGGPAAGLVAGEDAGHFLADAGVGRRTGSLSPLDDEVRTASPLRVPLVRFEVGVGLAAGLLQCAPRPGGIAWPTHGA